MANDAVTQAAEAFKQKETRKAKSRELEAKGARVIDPKAPYKVAQKFIA